MSHVARNILDGAAFAYPHWAIPKQGMDVFNTDFWGLVPFNSTVDTTLKAVVEDSTGAKIERTIRIFLSHPDLR